MDNNKPLVEVETLQDWRTEVLAFQQQVPAGASSNSNDGAAACSNSTSTGASVEP